MGNGNVLLRRTAGAIGLGWLLVLAIGGAVVVFTAVGFLLSWKINSRRKAEAHSRAMADTAAYEITTDGTDDHPRPGFLTRRLTKRKFMISAESMSSRLSLSLPPVLPPLPTYHSFGFFGSSTPTRSRSRSWVEEDKFHGPKVSRSARDSWFSRDAWFGRGPTLPSVELEASSSIDAAEKGRLPVSESMADIDQQIVVPKRRSQVGPIVPAAIPTLQQSKTAPSLNRDEQSRGRVRVTGSTHVRPSVTDSDLHDILRSTEQRLREGKSQSPTKTPRSSPLKMSPVKTPHSHRSVSSMGTVGINHMTPSPSKRNTVHGATPQSQSHGHSRNASISSIDSAANSLIAEATQELVLPGGLSSPSRLRGREWQQGENQLPEQNRPRSKSIESDASSSLSTLYSVGDAEDKKEPASIATQMDPFVDDRTTTNWNDQHLFAPGSQRGHNKSLSAVTLPRTLNPPTALSPFRRTSVSTQAVGGAPLPIVLQPPSEQRFGDEVNPKSYRVENIPLAFPVSSSETSMVTPTVTSVSDMSEDEETHIRDTPKAEWIPPRDEDRILVENPMSPSSMATSQFDEQDMISLLLSSSPRRALPEPPVTIRPVDESIIPTPLSPRPRRPITEQLRNISNSSSVYTVEPAEDPSTVLTGSPSKKTIRTTLREPPPQGSVGSAIAELRRMNSMISSYSVASIASTIQETDSPSLPALRGGGFAGSNSKHGSIGRQNYLNLGLTPPKKNPARLSRALSRNNNVGLGIAIREDEEGKENAGSEVKQPRPDSAQGLREGRKSSGNQGRDSAMGTRTKLRPVSELVAEFNRDSNRQSVESLGLYDKDGFLKSSPDRDPQRRSLRM